MVDGNDRLPIDAAEPDGRRPVGRRRLLALAGGAVVAVAAAGTGTVWLLRRDDATAAAEHGSGPEVVKPVRSIDLTWLPVGYGWTEWIRDPHRESLSGGTSTAGQSFVRATRYAPGVQPPIDYRDTLGSPWVDATGDERVDGRPTRWVGYGSGRRSARLRVQWEYRADGWAEIEFTGSAGQDNLPAALRIATGVTFDLNEPVRLPVTVGGLPMGWKLQEVDAYDPGNDHWAFNVKFGQQVPPITAGAAYPHLQVSVKAMNDAERFLMRNAVTGPDSTVDGHPARLDKEPSVGGQYHEQLRLWEVNGARVVVDIFGEQIRDAFAGGGALAVYRSLALHTERSRWV